MASSARWSTIKPAAITATRSPGLIRSASAAAPIADRHIRQWLVIDGEQQRCTGAAQLPGLALEHRDAADNQRSRCFSCQKKKADCTHLTSSA
jgi:hypothetical protein